MIFYRVEWAGRHDIEPAQDLRMQFFSARGEADKKFTEKKREVKKNPDEFMEHYVDLARVEIDTTGSLKKLVILILNREAPTLDDVTLNRWEAPQ